MNIVLNEDIIGSEDEADISSWLVADGDTVTLGQSLAELETSKVLLTLEAPAAGTIRLKAAEGDVATTGTVIATIEEAA